MHAKALLSRDFVMPPEDLGSSPWRYVSAQLRHGRYRYVIILRLAAGLDHARAVALLRAMHHNAALEGLQCGQHYQWCGLSAIGFRSKASAALFRLFML